MSDAVRYARDGSLAVVTFDDGKVNAMSLAFFRALGEVLDRAETEHPAALLFTGRPGVFSAGLDVKLLPTLAPEALEETLLAFACDLRIMAAGRFRLQLNEVAIGLTLPTWAIVLACAAIPPRWHTEAILHARAYAPEEALAREIVDRVVPPEQLLAAAREAAAPLAALDHAAYGGSKARLRALAVRWATDRLAEESRGALPLGRPDRG